MPWEAGTDEPQTAVVRFDPDVAWWAERQLPGGAVHHLDDGSLEATLEVANRDSLVGWLITFGASAEIVPHLPCVTVSSRLSKAAREGFAGSGSPYPLLPQRSLPPYAGRTTFSPRRGVPDAGGVGGRGWLTPCGATAAGSITVGSSAATYPLLSQRVPPSPTGGRNQKPMTSKTATRMVRLLSTVPWVIANPGTAAGEVVARFGYRDERELLADLAHRSVCGLPGAGRAT